ncbi:unnamed protein product [Angiostrongylus costaricensis]|uniref:Alpha-mannosidase n=1 Tax=Angiostrongylus costaricensis TaxID=334426 RepID=A0A0R3P9L5_ANGCS|nr:unnamed protein product [Angiostrongylus costaricensis]
MTFGLKKLEQLFGECGKPMVAWQIDPFGHSKEQANLFALMGYTSLFFARLHYLEKEDRLKNRSLEFIWNCSEDLKTQIFTGAFYRNDYGPPNGFCFDALCRDDPIMDNPDLEEYNLDEKISSFVTNQLCTAHHFQTSHGVRVFYSTPSCYVKGVLESLSARLLTKADDFFPYASSNHSYWTGYFTSRPTLKGMIREASSLMQLCKQLDALADLGPEDDSDIEIMARASALAQHHDAVTGTAKENVTKDYEKRLHKSILEGEVIINDYLKKIYPRKGKKAPTHILCPLLNESICQPLRNHSTFAVTVFNSNSRQFSGLVKIPYYSKLSMVMNPKGGRVSVQLMKTFQVSSLNSHHKAPFELVIPVEVGPLGYATYIVDNSTSVRSTIPLTTVRITSRMITDQRVSIENEELVLSFDENGLLAIFEEKRTNTSYEFRQEFFYYRAYVFRPDGEALSVGKAQLEVVKGPLVEEVRQTFNSWVAQIIRLKKGAKHIEFDWIIGPIPKEKSKKFNPSFKYVDSEPVSGNYYPVTNRAYINDANRQLTVLTDRSEGVTSIEGGLEIMLHRRCFVDDHWGVEEALDEPGNGDGLVARGTHYIALKQSQVKLLCFSEIADHKGKSYILFQFSAMKRSLPEFAHLMTLERWDRKSLLLRLEHIFQSQDDVEYSKPMRVDLTDLFTQFKVVRMTELMLAANRNISSFDRPNPYPSNFVITLKPMEIRTFKLDVDWA